ncbi:TRAP transporter small permease [Propionivibrio soli]|uniref:TRAP transporter small permease n=1 Tax=Propionivibrio soli TaxID=2976531 RepID=UPI0021E93C60|nr:TRAP transporter small permease [Propionivibrio soli]
MVGILKQLEKLIRGGVFVFFALMIVAVVVQVFARTFMAQPPVWTEEASRVSLLYIMGLGVGASVVTGDLVNVDLALMVMPKAGRRFCELVSAALVSLIGFVLVPGAWEFTLSGAMQTSPILQIEMQYIHASMLFFAALLGIFGFIKFLRILTDGSEDAPKQHSVGEA